MMQIAWLSILYSEWYVFRMPLQDISFSGFWNLNSLLDGCYVFVIRTRNDTYLVCKYTEPICGWKYYRKRKQKTVVPLKNTIVNFISKYFLNGLHGAYIRLHFRILHFYYYFIHTLKYTESMKGLKIDWSVFPDFTATLFYIVFCYSNRTLFNLPTRNMDSR